jgi:hypothetical protein
VPDPYEVDDEGDAVVEAEPAAGSDPATEAAVRRQIEMTLRTMALSTVIGLVVIAILAIAVSSIRSVLILVGIVYLVTLLAARWYLRRKFLSQLGGPGAGVS